MRDPAAEWLKVPHQTDVAIDRPCNTVLSASAARLQAIFKVEANRKGLGICGDAPRAAVVRFRCRFSNRFRAQTQLSR